jgi:hypothetical protein
VTNTPPTLRWVALFLAACAVLGLFLGFRDQIRKNPPGWYTGAERVAAPLPATSDGIPDAAPFDPGAPQSATAAITTTPATKAEPARTEKPDEDGEAAATPPPASTPPAKSTEALPVAKPRPAAPAPAPKSQPSADPVGDILEGQKSEPAPAAVPY